MLGLLSFLTVVRDLLSFRVSKLLNFLSRLVVKKVQELFCTELCIPLQMKVYFPILCLPLPDSTGYTAPFGHYFHIKLIYEHYNIMYDIIDYELTHMGMDFTTLLAVRQRQIISCVDVCTYRCLH